MPKKRTARPNSDTEIRRPAGTTTDCRIDQPEPLVLSDRDAAALVAALLDTAPRNPLLIMAAKAYLHRVDPKGTR